MAVNIDRSVLVCVLLTLTITITITLIEDLIGLRFQKDMPSTHLLSFTFSHIVPMSQLFFSTVIQA